MANLLNDGVIDAFCFGAGIPVPAFSDLDATQQVVFFTWTDPELATIRKSLPEFSEARIPKGTYKQQTDDQKTVGLFNFSIANKDMSDTLAYTITKTILENNAAMVTRPPRGQGDGGRQRHPQLLPALPSRRGALLQGKRDQARPGSIAEVILTACSTSNRLHQP